MASATDVPEDPSAFAGQDEEEPLLGRAGDASQKEGKPIYHNLLIGTGVVAQAGIWILVAVVWSGIFSHPLVRFFSPHPLLNSSALLLLAQGILILQPAHTEEQKRLGTYIHAIIQDIAIAAFIAALVMIEVNKFKGHGAHFESPHAIMGFTTYVLVILQTIVGALQFFAPGLFGGVEKAKAIYKYHRWAGYIIFTLGLATVCAATQTDYNKDVLHIQLWAVIVASVITLAGLLPRIKKGKMGF